MGTSARAKRGPYASGRQRRESINQATLSIIDEHGHERVSVAEVAARAATSEATVLYHFPTRDHLLAGALEFADEQLLASQYVRAAAGQQLDFDVFRNTMANSRQSSNRRALYLTVRGQSGTSGHPARDYFIRRTRKQLDIFAELIAGRQRAGLAHPGLDPHEAAFQVVALWEGVTSVSALSDAESADMVISGIRRLLCENWMEARRQLNGPQLGL